MIFCGLQIVLNNENTCKELYVLCQESSADVLKWNSRLTTAYAKYQLNTAEFQWLSKPLWRDEKTYCLPEKHFLQTSL